MAKIVQDRHNQSAGNKGRANRAEIVEMAWLGWGLECEHLWVKVD